MDWEAFGEQLIEKHRKELLELGQASAQEDEEAQAAGGDGFVVGGSGLVTTVLDGYETTVAYLSDDITESLELRRLKKVP